MGAPLRPEQQRAAGPPGTAPSATTLPGIALTPLTVQWRGPNRQHKLTELSVRTVSIGREPDNDVVLDGNEISRHHAAIERRGDAVAVRDLGSRNGVHCNGMRVELAPLEDGSVLRIGDWVGVVTRGSGICHELAPGLRGSSRLEAAIADLLRAAPSPLGLLVLGETGTGKELVARAAHTWSGRRGAFVALSCAALPESLVEAELFGHERGAFTGADKARRGHVRDAHGGTLFLDEVGELPLSAQAKLLRVLQEREVVALGSSEPIAVDLRIIAATHRDLQGMVEQGLFRADLLARLEGVVVGLPSLRARREDIYPLFAGFVTRALGRDGPHMTARFVESLLTFDWPSNVRELKATAERLAVLHGNEAEWHAHHLGRTSSRPIPVVDGRPPAVHDTGASRIHPPSVPDGVNSADALRRSPPRALGRDELVAALTGAGGVVSEAARMLRISKQSFYTLMEKHGVDVRAFRGQG
jgi:DNA-binding NtrC family response regulator